MTVPALQDVRIRVVEDEFFLADDLARMLQGEGAAVIGPAPTVDMAQTMLNEAARIDVAVLDVNLRDVLVYPLAHLLKSRVIPFLFTTGYDQGAIPDEYRDVPQIYKPYDLPDVLAGVVDLLPTIEAEKPPI